MKGVLEEASGAMQRVVSCLASNLLELILLPTEACNFRCTYCYQEFRHGKMRPSVVRGVLNLLSLRAPELDLLKTSWFGGEPLLGRDIIDEVQRHTRSLAREHPRLRLLSEITTNAYLLTRPVFEHLLDVGVTAYQIALDGPRDMHDRKRILADGRGTFERVWENLLALRDVPREFEVTLRLHADRENRATLPELVDECGKTFGGDRRFKLFVRPLSRLGGANDDSLPVLSGAESTGVVEALCTRYVGRLHSRWDGESDACAVCYAARANSFVVRADGRLNKCTVALEHPLNQVGRIHEDGSVEIRTPEMRGWMRGLWSGNHAELECPMHGYAEPRRNDKGVCSSPPASSPSGRGLGSPQSSSLA